jgi:hypothetical protein
MLVVGCNSATFGETGYTTLLDSIEVVQRLASTLESARSYRDFVSGLATPQEAVQLDWEFLVRAGEIMRIKIVDREGSQRIVIYPSGFRGMQAGFPQVSGRDYLAASSGLALWIWRGLGFAVVALLAVLFAGQVSLGLPDKILEVSARGLGGCAILAAGLTLLILSYSLVHDFPARSWCVSLCVLVARNDKGQE